MTDHHNKYDGMNDPFGQYRAEWMRDDLFKLYNRPNYFPELETARPCILVGGRGTGKTTVLRCLGYDGRYKLEGQVRERVPTWSYYGFYHRINTNRVTAFRGGGIAEEKWITIFGHYINLLLCENVAEFLCWYAEINPASPSMTSSNCAKVAESLGLSDAGTIEQLLVTIASGRRKFESYLNSLDVDDKPQLSMQGQPVDEICAGVHAIPGMENKNLFFIIDEFENLLDYQQEVLNTLIKHSGSGYTFKIGVRELGWRKKGTLNPEEKLISPADYELIDIGRKLDGRVFEKFAREVCRVRSDRLGQLNLSMTDLLPSLSYEEEATLLGVDEAAEAILAGAQKDSEIYATLNSMRSLEVYFADWWARSQKMPLALVLAERTGEPDKWRERFENYKVTILFALKGGKSGIRKYYSGWDTYVRLADGNIRYLLELIKQALLLHRAEGHSYDDPISAKIQTKAAQTVGEKNLRELAGFIEGARLTKLLLGLGRIFEVMAAQPEGHAPEVTQFHLPDDGYLDESVDQLLSAAVMHLALVRNVSSKRIDAEIKSFDFAVHPIYSAFFGFSHRKKRKMKLTSAQIKKLVETPRVAIKEILQQSKRATDSPLPPQLSLFEGFYGDS